MAEAAVNKSRAPDTILAGGSGQFFAFIRVEAWNEERFRTKTGLRHLPRPSEADPLAPLVDFHFSASASSARFGGSLSCANDQYRSPIYARFSPPVR
ncbi:MAG: hypothetical protein LBL45_07270 [Treponema sp.]|nr:hypothetical protein [Treponema sp.]